MKFSCHQILCFPSKKKHTQQMLHHIWSNGIIFHQPRFPWNSRGFPLLFTTIWGGKSVGSWGRELIWPPLESNPKRKKTSRFRFFVHRRQKVEDSCTMTKHPNGSYRYTYCWWKKSCTNWYVVYPIIYRVSYITGGAGFLPSTVWETNMMIWDDLYRPYLYPI